MFKSVLCLSSFLSVIGQPSACVNVQHGTGLQAGDGVTFPRPGDTVSIHYVGTLTNGLKFDSSRDRGTPFSTAIGVGQVIEGWDQGVPQLSLGESATLRISAACGYGSAGSPPTIPPNADLVFQVELLGINGRTAQQKASVRAPQPPVFTASASWNTASAPISTPISAGASWNTAFAPIATPVSTPALTSSAAPQQITSGSSLPECTANGCGRAISYNRNVEGTPVCLCNPICQTMAGTPGILPCCPKIQEVCLDPYRSPSPEPARKPQQLPVEQQPPAQRFSQQPLAQQPLAQQPLAQQPLAQQPLAQQQPAQGLAQTGSFQFQSNTLPQGTVQGTTFSAQGTVGQPLSQGVVAGTTITPLPTTITPMPATQPRAAPAQGGGQVINQNRPGAAQGGNRCSVGATKWVEQPTCVNKRYAIQEGKCKKVCDAVSISPQYWPHSVQGKAQCAAAVAACGYPPK